MATLAETKGSDRYWTYALWLALFTVFYNLAEGLISVFFGISDEALSLFGFGVDSFIEVMSGIGILAIYWPWDWPSQRSTTSLPATNQRPPCPALSFRLSPSWGCGCW